MNLLIALFVVLTGGVLGGIVLGIANRSRHRLRLPFGGGVELGFVGDAAIGAAAASAVFYLGGTFLGIEFNNIQDPNQFLKAIGVAVTAGFAGLGLLRVLSAKLLASTAETERLSERVEDFDLLTKSNRFVKSGDFFLHTKKDYGAAVEFYDHALDVYPKNVEALSKKSYALSNAGRLEEALSTIEKAAAIDPSYEAAFYNRACYKALLNYPPREIISDLRKAIELFPFNERLARDDDDFKSLRGNEEFRGLVNLPPNPQDTKTHERDLSEP